MASNSTTNAIFSLPEFTFTPSDTRLKITYKDAPAYAHVSSHAMALASPVWTKFFFPHWRDATASPVEEVDFTEDNAEALLILLCIAHLKFEQTLNKTPSREILIQLTMMCNKYFCHDLVKPWIGDWVRRECWNFTTKPSVN
jgi:hypothetical protein